MQARIPFFSWGSDSLPFSVNEPNFSLNTIVAGDWDSYITSWATAAKKLATRLLRLTGR